MLTFTLGDWFDTEQSLNDGNTTIIKSIFVQYLKLCYIQLWQNIQAPSKHLARHYFIGCKYFFYGKTERTSLSENNVSSYFKGIVLFILRETNVLVPSFSLEVKSW